MLDAFNRALDDVTGWIFEAAVQPAMYALGLMDWADDALQWIEFGLFGLFTILVVYAVCRPLEAWRPVEPVTDRGAIRTDIVYTLLTRLGLLPMVAFVLLASLQAWWAGLVADSGFVPPTLETLIPGLREMPLLAFLLYVVILDFGEYWRHRFQHMFGWWWALHSIHHAQRQMTFWTDDRNHILDEIIAALWFGTLALLIGVPPGQFPLLVLIMRLAESLSHANVRLSFGRLGERLLVSPRFHRVHHGVMSAAEHGRNYAVLFPVWDWIFGTADFRRDHYPRTGDPEAPEALATGGWLRQQVVGLRRMAGAIFRRGAA
ncbi:sterol desaturase family protein [Roseomonas alkaliterrae]|uniref:Sterol desaturase/sphingolipid hydroxylase (Fatty acid hydroxylase superfamily) n=1 Tax=Neoroseomonas alkaliterrae TaxID=1452450 RepID=A0A840Y1U9_9PROT|nr:sterol desaturase family protein [Neoroseomonas alkaliterrae]MBB5690347.1 sterol desaturase/sphingolipid hydroxylase (fatty acid hydroxylase superfamily) [Neoroseomonas alkaliterrae]MBR0675954.1 sterol desaturase family protein [Neoroseomonas alkaliterrae]